MNVIENGIPYLSDEQLATCVDEYIKRVITKARGQEYKNNIEVLISASQYQPESDYTIQHSVSMGYGRAKVESANALLGVEVLVRRWREDEGMAPQVVRPMLSAPTPTPEPKYTPYTSVEDEDDGIAY